MDTEGARPGLPQDPVPPSWFALRTARERALAAICVFLAVLFPLAPLRVSALLPVAAWLGEWLPPFWEFPIWMALDIALQMGLVLALVLLLRRRTGLRTTLQEWFPPRPLWPLALGLALNLPRCLPSLFRFGFGCLALPSSSHAAWSATYGVVMAPPSEELIFRGFLFGVLVREVRANPWVALLASSLVFGALHSTPPELFTLDGAYTTTTHAASGALFCWAFWRGGAGLLLPIGLHAGGNLHAHFIRGPEISDPVWVHLAYSITWVLHLGLTYIILRHMEERRTRAVNQPSATST